VVGYVMNDEFGRMRTEMDVAWSWHYTEGSQKTSLRTYDKWVESETRHVSTQVKNLTSTPIIR